MPRLGFSEERLDPDPPLAHRCGVGLCLVIAPHTVQGVGIQAAADAPSSLGRGALSPESASGTGRGRRYIDAPARAIALGEEAQRLASGAVVGISLRGVGEVLLSKRPRSTASL